jgi:hypothetical protein
MSVINRVCGISGSVAPHINCVSNCWKSHGHLPSLCPTASATAVRPVRLLTRSACGTGAAEGIFMADAGLTGCAFTGGAAPDGVAAVSENGAVHFLQLAV